MEQDWEIPAMPELDWEIPALPEMEFPALPELDWEFPALPEEYWEIPALPELEFPPMTALELWKAPNGGADEKGGTYGGKRKNRDHGKRGGRAAGPV